MKDVSAVSTKRRPVGNTGQDPANEEWRGVIFGKVPQFSSHASEVIYTAWEPLDLLQYPLNAPHKWKVSVSGAMRSSRTIAASPSPSSTPALRRQHRCSSAAECIGCQPSTMSSAQRSTGRRTISRSAASAAAAPAPPCCRTQPLAPGFLLAIPLGPTASAFLRRLPLIRSHPYHKAHQ